MIGRLLLAPVLAASAWALTADVAGADPACGAEVTTSITLTADLTCTDPGTPALVVGADRITVDLGGHTVTSAGPGVVNPGFEDVVVRNGVLAVEGPGVWYHGGAHRGTVADLSGAAVGGAIVLVEDSRRTTVVGSSIGGAISGSGIVLRRADDALVLANDVVANASDGIQVVDSWRVTVEANTARSNFGSGIAVHGGRGVVVRSNTVFNNDSYGIEVRGGTRHLVVANTVFHNGAAGVFIGPDAARTLVDANVVSDTLYGDGIHIASAGTVVRRNVAETNAGWGILAVAGVVDGGGNRASGNVLGDCMNVACA
jgi:parallel beta-helix repeat protein